MRKQTKIRAYYFAPQSWAGRLLITVFTLAALFLAMFFFTLFLIAIPTVIAFLVFRTVWAGRKIERNANEDFIEAEYTVEPADERSEKGHKRAHIDTTQKP